jgi:hypothetical protein
MQRLPNVEYRKIYPNVFSYRYYKILKYKNIEKYMNLKKTSENISKMGWLLWDGSLPESLQMSWSIGKLPIFEEMKINPSAQRHPGCCQVGKK